MHELLSEKPIVIELPVQWGEMDSYQHVNNVVYFRYFESARLELFRQMKWFEHEKESGIGPILASTQARYRLPLAYPDTVSVSAGVKEVMEDRFVLEHLVVSHKQNQITTIGEGLVVVYDYRNSTKTSMPDELRRRLESFAL